MHLNRLFFALWPEPPVRAAMAEAARQLRIRTQPPGHPVRPEMLHLTLLFLGSSVSAAQQADAVSVAAGVRTPPFSLWLDHAGCFRGARAPWWLGVQAVPAELSSLHERLRAAVQRVGLVPDRTRLVPHVTVQRDAGVALARTPVPPIEWPVREFVLLRSRLDQHPAQYEVLGRWPLNGAAEGSAADQLSLW
jgi:2'-5' RNA ligase